VIHTSLAIQKLTCLVFLTCIFKYSPAQDSSVKCRNITRNVFLDSYYSFDFSRPANHEKPSFIYNHKRHNEVNINLALASLTYRDANRRANFALMAGTYPQYNLAAEPELLRHIYEANAGLRLTKKKEIWLDVGILPSHIGFESAISKDSWTVTRSLLAENSPYYEAGVKLSYTTPGKKWYIAGLYLNGWQRINRPKGNNTPSFGTQVTYTPTENITVNSSSFIGNDQPDSLRRWRYFHNFFGIFHLNERWSLTTGFDIGIEQKIKNSSQTNLWYSPVIITRYNTEDKFTLAFRVEYFSDRQGVLISANTPNGFQTMGYSANMDYAFHENFIWRIEARHLKSRDPIFEGRNQFNSNTTWITTSLAVAF
jgi:hypothetical protein